MTQQQVFVIVSYVVVAAMIWQSMRRRLVRDRRPMVLSAIFLAYGVTALLAASPGLTLTPTASMWAVVLVVLAVALGAVRGATIRLRGHGGDVERRGTWSTLGAWALAFAVHAVVRLAMGHDPGAVALASGGLVLYAAITHLAQVMVVRARAQRQAFA